MVDVFGGLGNLQNRSGPQGPRGPRGLPGSIRDFCTWLPNSILENLQTYDECGCFVIKDPEKDLELSKKVVKKWISRSVIGWNLVAEKPSSDLVKLNDRYALGFKKNRYVSTNMPVLETFSGMSAFLCVTFKMSGEGEQVLISNYEEDINNDYCEIRVTATEIILHLHSDDEIVQHSCKHWTTLFIECNSDDTTTYFKYDVNGVTGSYTRPSMKMFLTESVALGSRYDDTHFLSGQVSALEFYQTNQPSEVPEELKKIVIKNQRIV